MQMEALAMFSSFLPNEIQNIVRLGGLQCHDNTFSQRHFCLVKVWRRFLCVSSCSFGERGTHHILMTLRVLRTSWRLLLSDLYIIGSPEKVIPVSTILFCRVYSKTQWCIGPSYLVVLVPLNHIFLGWPVGKIKNKNPTCTMTLEEAKQGKWFVMI